MPYDVDSRVRVLTERQAAGIAAGPVPADERVSSHEAQVAAQHGADGPDGSGGGSWGGLAGQRPARRDPGRDADQVSAPGVASIGSLTRPGRAAAEGRVVVVEIRPVERNSVLACEISDGTGQLTALFYGRSHIPGIVCGARVRFRGSVGIKGGGPVMINPAYELLFPAV